jgi:hypothetical protein
VVLDERILNGSSVKVVSLGRAVGRSAFLKHYSYARFFIDSDEGKDTSHA